MLSQKFWINYRPFPSVVLCTQTLHQQWLHTRACYKNHRPATIMVISLSLRFVDQIGTSVRFWQKKSEMLKLWRRLWAKRLHWQSCHLGGSYLFMKYDVFIQNAEFFLGIELSALSIIKHRKKNTKYPETTHRVPIGFSLASCHQLW